MKNKIFAAAAFVAVLLSFSLTSCAPKGKQKFTDYSFDYFDTVTTVIGYADSKEAFDEVFDFVMAELEKYHKLYNIYDSFDDLNNLKSLNELKNSEHQKLKVNSKIIDLLSYCKEMHTLTGGQTNVAMGSVLSLWHQSRTHAEKHPDDASLPDRDKLSAAANHTDISDLIIDRENSTVYLADSEMTLDVGAIAKGFAVEMIGRALKEKGVSGYLLNVGGNVKAIGAKADGEGWSVGIENPDRDDENTPHIAYLKLSDKSLVTSGNYQRYYTIGDKRYHHIIDPETLMPSEYFSSVSVLCENSAMADALSTALFTMPLSEGTQLIESISHAEAMWVEPDGEIHYSSGFENYTFDYEG